MENKEDLILALHTYTQENYNRVMDTGYILYCIMFSLADEMKKNLESHHIVPRCCGGKDEPMNLIKITKEHHTKLHKMILKSNLNENERKNLEYAYGKRTGKIK